MQSLRATAMTAVVALAALAACDDDPTGTAQPLLLNACPSGLLGVNAPIPLEFNQRILSGSVNAGNIVVTDVNSGVQLPGALTLDTTTAGITRVNFTPSEALPFGARLLIRIQNLVSTASNTAIAVTTCDVQTEPPFITQVVWRQLQQPTGDTLVGAAPLGASDGYVISAAIPIFRKQGNDFDVVFNLPFYLRGNDISFPHAAHGFASHLKARPPLAGVISHTFDGGATWDTLVTVPNEEVNRLWLRRRSASDTTPFGAAGGGTTSSGRILRYDPTIGNFTSVFNTTTTSFISDIDFANATPNGTVHGAAVSHGRIVRNPAGVVTTLTRGRVFVTSDSGKTWTEVPEAAADTISVRYQGVAIRSNRDIYVAAGGGRMLRLAAPTAAGGAYTVTRINTGAPFTTLINSDTLNPNALIFYDVQFAPDNDQIGWIVGAQLVGENGGVPRYQGFIFETRNGGGTWTRQGVIGAANYGGEIPALKRIAALSSTRIWLVGAGGTVLEYMPTTSAQ